MYVERMLQIEKNKIFLESEFPPIILRERN